MMTGIRYNLYRQERIVRLEKGGVCDAASEFDWLARELADITRLRAIQNPALEITPEQAKKIDDCIAQRLSGIPLQYILGKCYFMEIAYVVQPGVLIPRYDTEILVTEAISHIKSKKAAVLDLCTGSGCIGLSVLRECPETTCTMADISKDALSVCKINAQAQNLTERCQMIQSDLFENLQGQRFDFILSNPPYIKEEVIKTLDPEVKDWEPYIALCGGADGLDFYRKIIQQAPRHLNSHGELFLEIGYDQADEVYSLLEKNFTDITLKYDYGNHPRVIHGQLK